MIQHTPRNCALQPSGRPPPGMPVGRSHLRRDRQCTRPRPRSASPAAISASGGCGTRPSRPPRPAKSTRPKPTIQGRARLATAGAATAATSRRTTHFGWRSQSEWAVSRLKQRLPKGPLQTEFSAVIRRAYYAAISLMDDSVGQTLAVLKVSQVTATGRGKMWFEPLPPPPPPPPKPPPVLRAAAATTATVPQELGFEDETVVIFHADHVRPS